MGFCAKRNKSITDSGPSGERWWIYQLWCESIGQEQKLGEVLVPIHGCVLRADNTFYQPEGGIVIKTLFKDNPASYLTVFCLGVIAGLLVVLFCEFPNNELWSFYYWSSDTFGFWMFSTALIVLCSEKRKNAAVNAALYIFLMFLITTIYKSFHMYWKGYTHFESLAELAIHHMSGWFLYSIPPAILCGVLGAILWSGINCTL